MYRGLMKKRLGVAPGTGSAGSIDYDLGGSEYPQGTDKKQRKGIDYLYKYGQITSSEYRQLNRVSARTATQDLNKLVTRKILRKCGSGKSTFYVLA
jgi:predicted HTH transcriptional regulator